MRGYHIIPYVSWVSGLLSLYTPPWEKEKNIFFLKIGGMGGMAA